MAPTPQPGPDQAQMKRMALSVVAIVVLILVGLFFARLSAPATGEPEKVEAALRGSASTLLAGTGEPAALAAATCEVEGDDGTEYLCIPKGVPAGQGVHFVLADDGSITKDLSGDSDLETQRTGDAVAKALAADEKARGLGDPEYGCATSIRLSPDGTVETGNAAGFLCAAKTTATPAGASAGADGSGASTPAAGADNQVDPGEGAAGGSVAVGGRYVEVAPDGTLRRDYVIGAK